LSDYSEYVRLPALKVRALKVRALKVRLIAYDRLKPQSLATTPWREVY